MFDGHKGPVMEDCIDFILVLQTVSWKLSLGLPESLRLSSSLKTKKCLRLVCFHKVLHKFCVLDGYVILQQFYNCFVKLNFQAFGLFSTGLKQINVEDFAFV